MSNITRRVKHILLWTPIVLFWKCSIVGGVLSLILIILLHWNAALPPRHTSEDNTQFWLGIHHWNWQRCILRRSEKVIDFFFFLSKWEGCGESLTIYKKYISITYMWGLINTISTSLFDINSFKRHACQFLRHNQSTHHSCQNS